MEGIGLHLWEKTFKLSERFNTVSLHLERHLEQVRCQRLLSTVKRKRYLSKGGYYGNTENRGRHALVHSSEQPG